MRIKNIKTRNNIRFLKPYEAKDIHCKVRLDANESPFPVDVSEFLSNTSVFKRLNRYPDPGANEVKRALAKDLRIRPENLLIGNGSDEIISYLITTFGGPVMYPVPTFSMYGIISQAIGMRHKGIPLARDFDIDIEKMINVIKKSRPRLIFISSPNNPTGNCFSAGKIERIIEETDAVVVVDEAYQPYSGNNVFLSKIKKHKNLALLRTFSKIGFAALRVGFLIADKDIINEVNKVRLPFNLNAISQDIAAWALKNKKAISEGIEIVVSERKRITNSLNEINGIAAFKSDANFVLFRVSNARSVYDSLIRKGILIRDLSGIVRDCLRVTIGTREENDIFLKAIRLIAKANKMTEN
ncbi:MAG: histidinol-phosphate transaminase [Nitrospirae bacterium]|nr:histidinol-phosphate transaminase [Nitrospirota bacterium]